MDMYRLRHDQYFMRALREQARHGLHGDVTRFTDQELFDLMKVEEHFKAWQRRQASLLFDGETLFWQETGQERKWTAYSGRKGYWSPKFQSLRDEGPIPEGFYQAQQSKLQSWSEVDQFSKTFCFAGFGSWPGCTDSWGEQRVWLMAKSHTNVYGRSGFSIHGGNIPGSAGCIDLTHSMNDFTERFRSYGKDIALEVRYKPLRDSKGYHSSHISAK